METTPEDFKHLKPDGYMPDGAPLFDCHTVAKLFGISPEEAEQRMRAMLMQQQVCGLPMDGKLTR